MSLSALLARRLLFTVGKGGVGRTTVTLALALEAARRGKRVLVVELEGARGLEHALGGLRRAADPASGLERISYLAVDGRAALEEYLAMVIPVRRLLSTIFESAIYQYFVAAAPGLKELMTVGKIWFEANRSESGAEDAPEIVLVDAPATGHSLQYLRMPAAALEAFPVGLVHREAERVLGLLRDPLATAVVVVSTAEEMPANETLEIFSGLGEIGLSIAALVLNQVHSAPCDPSVLERLGRAVSDEERRSDDLLFAEAVRRAEEEAGWARLNARQVERLREATGTTTTVFPYLFREEFGATEVLALAGILRSEGGGDPS
ncbi:MAG: ArsA family ATPase [Candidatus Binatia bacterium]|nr:ArsA family ATPase [Candidatus Binatia bacterium]